MTKPVRMNAFVMNTVAHQSPGLWRHPRDRSGAYNQLQHWTSIAKTLEAGLFDAMFLADVFGVYDVYGGSADAALRGAVQLPINDPFVLIPAMAAAWLLRKPRMIHEANGVLGRVNELFARRVQVVACGIWPTVLPKGTRAEHTGNPVRAAILEHAGAPYIPPGDYPMSILVMGGSQGARVMSDMVPPAISALPQEIRRNIRVSHQARPEDVERVKDYYDSELITADVQTFFDDVPRRMTEAQLVISRSGASTVADVSVIGRPAIWVPYAGAIRDEQTANARGIVEVGGAILIPESQFTPQALADNILAVFDDPHAATLMANAALSRGKPDATDALVEMVETLAGKTQTT